MKSFYLALTLLLTFSCSSNKATTASKNNTAKTSTNLDCSDSIEEYVRNNQGLITNSTERYSINKISKLGDGSYDVQLRWESGISTGRVFMKQFSVDENCTVVKIK